VTTDRRQEIDRLFRTACERASDERSAYLDSACRDDAELRREVESLLASRRRTGSVAGRPDTAFISAAQTRVLDMLAPGQRVGQYTILRRIGAGGMGEVYLALDTRLGLNVALKIPGKGFVTDPERIRRFRLEARAAAALANPHIITVYDIGEADSLHYIATEYIEGETVRQRLKRGPMALGDAVDVAMQVASALHAAHVAGVVHRDIKPENLMLQPDGLLKILDFGIAKLLAPSPGAGPETTQDLLRTAPGQMMGTANYVSPEQAQGLEVDERTDLWSLGVVLYEMVTGHRPFEGSAFHQVLMSVIDREPDPLRNGAPDAPEELERVVARTLTKDPDCRYQHAEELFGDLRRIAGTLAKARIAIPRTEEVAPTEPNVPAKSSAVGERGAPNNLPFSLTSFVGRDGQIAAVRERLAVSRLVTLCGPGGIGKTRLAVEVARAQVSHGADRVWLVELAAHSDPALVPSVVAQALGVPEKSDVGLVEAIGRSLATKRILLVLDNCEHLIEACARLVSDLLRACPGLWLLATSREPLGVRGEAVMSVPALTLPDLGDRLPVERLRDYEATRLFVDRASLSRSGFVPTERNARSIADVCRRLDGIPLAIEFAAARLKALTVEQILAKLEDRFRLLTSGGRTAPLRHQTLRGAIDWSHDLLSDGARIFLRRLSVFAGGWTLEGAESVCGGLESDAHRSEILELLTRLVDASFVTAENRDGRVRYGMLETVHEYASERLRESGEESTVRARHCAWYFDLAEAAEPRLVGPEQGTWLDRLEDEHDNLSAALRWSIGNARDEGNVATALGFCRALGRFWSLHGHLSEGRALIEQALAAAPDGSHPLRPRVCYWSGHLACRQGDMVTARERIEESLALSRALGDTQGCALSLHELFAISSYGRDFDRARPFAEEALAMFREANDLRGVGLSYIALGNIAVAQGDDEQAARWYEDGLAITRTLGDRRAEVANLNNLGQIATRRGDVERGRAYLENGFEIARELGDRMSMSFLTHTFANLLMRSGDLEGARRLYAESLSVRRELGFARHIADILEEMASLAVLAGCPGRAARFVGAAGAIRERSGAGRDAEDEMEMDRVLDDVRRALGAESDLALAEGRAMSLDEVVELALREHADG
jgi:predicted ATPase/serine/threonine protein kinase